MSRASIPKEDRKQVASVSVEGWQKRWLDENKGKYNFSLRAREMLTRDIEEIEGFLHPNQNKDYFDKLKTRIGSVKPQDKKGFIET